MKVVHSELKGVMVLEPGVFDDRRGYFMEIHNRQRYGASGVDRDFVQDNLSFSSKNTLRGLHYQQPHSQAKLVQVITGEVFDVVVDIRRGSPTFGRWQGFYLSDVNHHQVFIPEGFAHGFCVLSDTAHMLYKCTDFYSPEDEKGILWSDPDLSIDWPVKEPLLSPKDRDYPLLGALAPDHLFAFESET